MSEKGSNIDNDSLLNILSSVPPPPATTISSSNTSKLGKRLSLIRRVKETIENVENKKKDALSKEDYATALDMKRKLQDLNAQLLKVQYSDYGEVMGTIFANWLDDIAQLLALSRIYDNGKRKKLDFETPLKSPCHANFRTFVANSSPFYFESLTVAILSIVPLDTPNLSLPVRGISEFLKRSPTIFHGIEFPSMFLLLACLDILTEIINRYDGQNISNSTLENLVRHAFHYCRIATTALKSLPSNVARYFKFHLDLRFSIILGDLTLKSQHFLCFIVETFDEFLENRRKYTLEELLQAFSIVKYLQLTVDGNEIIKVVEKLIDKCMLLIMEAKKIHIKNAIINLLEHVMWTVFVMDPETELPATVQDWRRRVEEKFVEVFTAAKEWLEIDGVREEASFLVSTLIIQASNEGYSSISEFLEPFLERHLLALPVNGDRTKGYVFDCALKLLWGNFRLDSLEGTKAYLNDETYFSTAWSESINFDILPANAYAKLVNFCLVENSNYPLEYADTLVHIVLQVASDRIELVLEKVLPKLYNNVNKGTSGDKASATICTDLYVAIRALKLLLSPDYEFLEKSRVARSEPSGDGVAQDTRERLERLLNDHIEQYSEAFSEFCLLCEQTVGVKRTGIRSNILLELGASSGSSSGGSYFADIYERQLWSSSPIYHLINEYDASSATSGSSSVQNPVFDHGASLSLSRVPPNPWFRRKTISSSRDFEFDTHFIHDLFGGDGEPNSTSSSHDDSLVYAQAIAKLQNAFEAFGRLNPQSLLDLSKNPHRLDHKHPSDDGKRMSEYFSFAVDITASPEYVLASSIYVDLLQVIDLFPVPELHYGRYFIGYHILNINDDIASASIETIRRLFADNRPVRCHILNSILNLARTPESLTFFKPNTSSGSGSSDANSNGDPSLIPHSNSISCGFGISGNTTICNILLAISGLLSLWIREIELDPLLALDESAHQQKIDYFLRVSDKIDTIAMVYLARSCVKMRQLCIRVMNQFWQLSQIIFNHGKRNSSLPKGSSVEWRSLLPVLLKKQFQIAEEGYRSFSSVLLRSYPSFELASYQELQCFFRSPGPLCVSLHEALCSPIGTLWTHYYWCIVLEFAHCNPKAFSQFHGILALTPIVIQDLNRIISARAKDLLLQGPKLLDFASNFGDQDIVGAANLIMPTLYYPEVPASSANGIAPLDSNRGVLSDLIYLLKSEDAWMIEMLSCSMRYLNSQSLVNLVSILKNWYSSDLEKLMQHDPKTLIVLSLLLRNAMQAQGSSSLFNCVQYPLDPERDGEFVQAVIYLVRIIEFYIGKVLQQLEMVNSAAAAAINTGSGNNGGAPVSANNNTNTAAHSMFNQVIELFGNYGVIVSVLCQILQPNYLSVSKGDDELGGGVTSEISSSSSSSAASDGNQLLFKVNRLKNVNFGTDSSDKKTLSSLFREFSEKIFKTLLASRDQISRRLVTVNNSITSINHYCQHHQSTSGSTFQFGLALMDEKISLSRCLEQLNFAFSLACSLGRQFTPKTISDDILLQIIMLEKNKVRQSIRSNNEYASIQYGEGGIPIFPYLLYHDNNLFLDFCFIQCYGKRPLDSVHFFRVLCRHFGLYPTPVEFSTFCRYTGKKGGDLSQVLIVNCLDDPKISESIRLFFGHLLFLGLYFFMHVDGAVRREAIFFLHRLLPVVLQLEQQASTTAELEDRKSHVSTNLIVKKLDKMVKQTLSNHLNDPNAIKRLALFIMQDALVNVTTPSSKFGRVFIRSFFTEAVRCLKVSDKTKGRHRFMINEQGWILCLVEAWLPYIPHGPEIFLQGSSSEHVDEEEDEDADEDGDDDEDGENGEDGDGQVVAEDDESGISGGGSSGEKQSAGERKGEAATGNTEDRDLLFHLLAWIVNYPEHNKHLVKAFVNSWWINNSSGGAASNNESKSNRDVHLTRIMLGIICQFAGNAYQTGIKGTDLFLELGLELINNTGIGSNSSSNNNGNIRLLVAIDYLVNAIREFSSKTAHLFTPDDRYYNMGVGDSFSHFLSHRIFKSASSLVDESKSLPQKHLIGALCLFKKILVELDNPSSTIGVGGISSSSSSGRHSVELIEYFGSVVPRLIVTLLTLFKPVQSNSSSSDYHFTSVIFGGGGGSVDYTSNTTTTTTTEWTLEFSDIFELIQLAHNFIVSSSTTALSTHQKDQLFNHYYHNGEQIIIEFRTFNTNTGKKGDDDNEGEEYGGSDGYLKDGNNSVCAHEFVKDLIDLFGGNSAIGCMELVLREMLMLSKKNLSIVQSSESGGGDDDQSNSLFYNLTHDIQAMSMFTLTLINVYREAENFGTRRNVTTTSAAVTTTIDNVDNSLKKQSAQLQHQQVSQAYYHNNLLFTNSAHFDAVSISDDGITGSSSSSSQFLVFFMTLFIHTYYYNYDKNQTNRLKMNSLVRYFFLTCLGAVDEIGEEENYPLFYNSLIEFSVLVIISHCKSTNGDTGNGDCLVPPDDMGILFDALTLLEKLVNRILSVTSDNSAINNVIDVLDREYNENLFHNDNSDQGDNVVQVLKRIFNGKLSNSLVIVIPFQIKCTILDSLNGLFRLHCSIISANNNNSNSNKRKKVSTSTSNFTVKKSILLRLIHNEKFKNVPVNNEIASTRDLFLTLTLDNLTFIFETIWKVKNSTNGFENCLYESILSTSNYGVSKSKSNVNVNVNNGSSHFKNLFKVINGFRDMIIDLSSNGNNGSEFNMGGGDLSKLIGVLDKLLLNNNNNNENNNNSSEVATSSIKNVFNFFSNDRASTTSSKPNSPGISLEKLLESISHILYEIVWESAVALCSLSLIDYNMKNSDNSNNDDNNNENNEEDDNLIFDNYMIERFKQLLLHDNDSIDNDSGRLSNSAFWIEFLQVQQAFYLISRSTSTSKKKNNSNDEADEDAQFRLPFIYHRLISNSSISSGSSGEDRLLSLINPGPKLALLLAPRSEISDLTDFNFLSHVGVKGSSGLTRKESTTGTGSNSNRGGGKFDQVIMRWITQYKEQQGSKKQIIINNSSSSSSKPGVIKTAGPSINTANNSSSRSSPIINSTNSSNGKPVVVLSKEGGGEKKKVLIKGPTTSGGIKNFLKKSTKDPSKSSKKRSNNNTGTVKVSLPNPITNTNPNNNLTTSNNNNPTSSSSGHGNHGRKNSATGIMSAALEQIKKTLTVSNNSNGGSSTSPSGNSSGVSSALAASPLSTSNSNANTPSAAPNSSFTNNNNNSGNN